jgi:hypothetical protein
MVNAGPPLFILSYRLFMIKNYIVQANTYALYAFGALCALHGG